MDKNKKTSILIFLIMLLIAVANAGGKITLSNVWQIMLTIGIYIIIGKIAVAFVGAIQNVLNDVDKIKRNN